MVEELLDMLIIGYEEKSFYVLDVIVILIGLL